MFEKYRHIHFVGIGGIGMSGIAEVLLNLGYQVTGSDLKRSSTTARLKKRGAKVVLGHRRENMNGAQVVVVSSAVGENNPEVALARQKHIPVVPRGEMLAELMRLKYSVCVAGTHGKTTTTSLIGAVLQTAGRDPTLIIGGKVNSLKSNARLGKGEFLVAESDESDRSFLHLNPTIAVVTNIDPEHLENYRDFAHLQQSFITFANKVPFYGCVVACNDHPVVREVLKQISRRVVTYGLHEGADYLARQVEQNQGISRFQVWHCGEMLGEVELHLPGEHHVTNALAAVAVGRELEIPFRKISAAVRNFKGINRRFTILRRSNPMVVDDYGHHPIEIEKTIEAVRANWPDHQLICVVQPHRYSRVKALWDDFVRVLAKPDRVVLLPIYPAGEKPIAGITTENLSPGGNHQVTNSVYCKTFVEVETTLQSWLNEKTIVLFLGAGDVTKMARQFAKGIQ